VSLQGILNAIQATGENQAREIQEDAQAQAQQILAQAGTEAERLRQRSRQSAAAPASEERLRILHQAKLEALQVVNDAREELIDEVLRESRARLAEIRKDLGYPKLLRRLTREALAELRGSLKEDAVIWLQADPRDRSPLQSILTELGPEVQTGYGLDCWGGVVCRSEDGRVVVVNTLEGRLDCAVPHLHRHLGALFEGDRSHEGGAAERERMRVVER
jgi:V/A-type H+-transporting ATPase subunit E